MDLQDAESLAASARRIEELGYAELYSYDHLGAVDPFAPLMVAASATTRLRVGPLVLNNEFHHPALIARTAATVDRLIGGRLVLGIGTGYAEHEHQAANIELRPPGLRVERLQESLHAIRELLDNGAVRMDGQHHRLAIEDLGVRPVQNHVPLLVGGHGHRVIATAARVADIFQFTGLTRGERGSPQPGGFAFAAIAERAQWLSEVAGDRDDDIERSVLVQAVAIGEGADAAAEQASERLALDRAEIDSSPFVLFGSVEQVVDELEARRESLGISHVVVRDHDGFAPVVEALANR